MDIQELFTLSLTHKASDLHLSAGLPPILRVDGELQMINSDPLEACELENFLFEVMNNTQREKYKKQMELDFSFQFNKIIRFRANVFTQTRGISAVFRSIPSQVLSISELGFPSVFQKIAAYTKGLVLITGPTGSGKSTTLAALIDHINTTQTKHILTIEDPVEFVHSSKRCLVQQREVFKDTKSFPNALRSALREDPDIILIGELRDLETIRLAMTAAETGHLVFATLHTNSATQTIHRIIDVFPSEEKSLIRTMLAESLQAVIAQNLIPRIGGGRIAAWEILIANSAIRNLIREDKIAQMYSSLQTGQKVGMRTLDQHLSSLVNEGIISKQNACEIAVHKPFFEI